VTRNACHVSDAPAALSLHVLKEQTKEGDIIPWVLEVNWLTFSLESD